MHRLTLLSAALLSVPPATAQAPAFCPVPELTTCKDQHLEHCTPTIWHGIDSLEVFELTPINDTAIRIRSLSDPPSFDDTVGSVVVRAHVGGGPVDPRYCVRAPPKSTQEGNCTTRVRAFFSDANVTLETLVMESCGILSWKPAAGGEGSHLYGQWVHADEPKPSPRGALCDWQPGLSLYREVGGTDLFTLESVQTPPDEEGASGGGINQTAVRIHSVNGSFPDTTATVHEVGGGTPGKIAWRAQLFGRKLYRGIMRANSAGGPACCEVKRDSQGVPHLEDCPVVSWWTADGSRTSCWAPVQVPWDGVVGACGE